MVAKLFSVEPDLTGVSCAVEFQKQPLTGGLFCCQLSNVPAGPAVIIVSAILAVHSVPGVG